MSTSHSRSQTRPGPTTRSRAPGAAPELDRYDRTRHEHDGYPAGLPGTVDPGSLDLREPVAVLTDVLGRDGAELSATQTRRELPVVFKSVRGSASDTASTRTSAWPPATSFKIIPTYPVRTAIGPSWCSPAGPPPFPDRRQTREPEEGSRPSLRTLTEHSDWWRLSCSRRRP
jgi:hypothetical protein